MTIKDIYNSNFIWYGEEQKLGIKEIIFFNKIMKEFKISIEEKELPINGIHNSEIIKEYILRFIWDSSVVSSKASYEFTGDKAKILKENLGYIISDIYTRIEEYKNKKVKIFEQGYDKIYLKVDNELHVTFEVKDLIFHVPSEKIEELDMMFN